VGLTATPPRLIIQHHPSRAALLDRLVSSLGPTPFDVVVDPDPDGPPSAWRTYRRCLSERPGEDVVIVQDDAVAADGVADAIPAIADANPGRLVVLYVGGMPVRTAKRIRRMADMGHRYAAPHPDDWVPTVALIWPAALRVDLLDWADRHGVKPDALGDDSIVGRWAGHRRLDVVCTIPSLFQHPDDEPSLIGRKHKSGANPFRVAARFTGSADHDWSVR
jgi:hypothetical protein